MTPRIVFVALCSLTLVACGGSVALHETGGQGSGGGSTGSTGSTGEGGYGGLGGAGGYAGEGGYGGIGGTGGACSDTSDHFVFTLVGPDGNIDCTKAVQGTSQKAHVEGVVISSGANTLTVDTCPPGTACDGSQYTLAIDSPGFGAYVNTGTFVQIDVAVDFPWGCTNTLMVRNLPSFGGQPGPAGDVPWLMFAGSDGSSAAPEGAPFTLTTTPLGCNPSGQSCGGPVADSYRFDFNGTEVVPVYEGDSQLVHIAQGQGATMMLFRNLRSYESGWCDDYWNYAYWITPAPIPD